MLGIELEDKCDSCGNKFVRKTSWQKYCSYLCRKRHFNKVNPLGAIYEKQLELIIKTQDEFIMEVIK